MKYLLTALLCLGFYFSYAQSKNHFDTLLLQKATHSGIFKGLTYGCTYPDVQLRLIDPNNYFSSCQLSDTSGATITLIHDPVYADKNFLCDTIYTNGTDNILLFKIVKLKGQMYMMYFVQPHSEYTLSMVMQRKKHKVKLLWFGIGNF